MKGLRVFIVTQVLALFTLAGVVIWTHANFDAQREADCRQALETRAANTENSVAEWRDLAEIVAADEEGAAAVEELVDRIRNRSDALPPPASCL